MGSEGLGELSILPDQWWCLVVSEIWNRRKHTSWNTPRKRQSSCVVKSVFSEKILRLIHLFERLLFFYFPIIWLDWFICSKGFYYFIFQLFGQIEEYKQNNFPLTGGSVIHLTFHCRKLTFQPLRELEVIIKQGTWTGYGKRLKENFIFSLFLLLLFLFQESKIKYILFLRFAWKNCAVKSFLGWTFFPFVRINEVLFYLQRWQVWLLPICRRNISAAIKRQSSALSDF